MCGLEKVRAEFSLTALVYNLRRVLNILGTDKMMAAVAGIDRGPDRAVSGQNRPWPSSQAFQEGHRRDFSPKRAKSADPYRSVVASINLDEFSHGLREFRTKIRALIEKSFSVA